MNFRICFLLFGKSHRKTTEANERPFFIIIMIEISNYWGPIGLVISVKSILRNNFSNLYSLSYLTKTIVIYYSTNTVQKITYFWNEKRYLIWDVTYWSVMLQNKMYSLNRFPSYGKILQEIVQMMIKLYIIKMFHVATKLLKYKLM